MQHTNNPYELKIQNSNKRPAAWKQIKKSIMEDETAFVSDLRNAWTHKKTS